MSARKSGFTLIELLVVIAIIAILAAMLFPVFARARESARKIQCLSNVKNLATAMQIYLSDYDKFPPANDDPAAIELMTELAPWYALIPGCPGDEWINPWIQWPVVLESYIGNRDIWACPSARMQGALGDIIPSNYPGGYVAWWAQLAGVDIWGGTAPRFCDAAWPEGWGGTITDSFTQFGLSGGPNVFHMEIAANLGLRGKSVSRFDDPSWYVTFGDAGTWASFGYNIMYAAIPDACAATQVICYPDGPSYSPDCIAVWEAVTGAIREMWVSPAYKRNLTDAAIRIGARHLGGSNLGFADGHAAWMAARQIFAEAPRYSQGGYLGSLVYKKLKGLDPGMPTSAGGDPAAGVAEGTWPVGCGGSDPTPIYQIKAGFRFSEMLVVQVESAGGGLHLHFWQPLDKNSRRSDR